MKYPLYLLSYSEFEDLVVLICTEILGEATTGFAPGRDGGRDAIFKGVANSIPSEAKAWDGAFEMFLRSESTTYFDKVKPILAVNDKTGFDPLIKGIQDKTVYVPKWGFDSMNPLALMNYENLCTME